MWFVLSVVAFTFFYFNNYEKKLYLFLYTGTKRAPSPPISPIRGNGDASTALIIRGNIPVSNAR
jgi:hypothetical protein